MKKVMIIGCAGAGKSYFAKKLHNITEIPLYHLDLIWHKPDKTHISREEFDETLKRIFQEDTWIMDGDYSRTYSFKQLPKVYQLLDKYKHDKEVIIFRTRDEAEKWLTEIPACGIDNGNTFLKRE